jgi:hypothetical protein
MGRKKTNKNYFTQDTEDAIIEYLTTKSHSKRNKIFNDRIYYALYKLSENLIHTFKFYYTEVDDLEDLKHEVITFLLEKLHYFDPSKGFKAYSYFSIVGKNYLILYNNKNYTKKKQMGDLVEADSDIRVLNNIEHDIQREDKKDFLYYFIEYMENNLEKLYTDPLDHHIAHSVVYLFKQRENLEIFNKKALYIYIREITDCETPAITRVIKQMKSQYLELFNQYEDIGQIEGL